MKVGVRLAGVLCLSLSASVILAPAGMAGPAAAAVRPAARPEVPGQGYSSQLAGVACRPSGPCWTVGSYTTGQGTSQSEALRWTGQGWVQASVPEPRSQSGLSAVSCTSAGGCRAVGYTANIHGRESRAEVLRWNGTAWSVASAPAVPGLQALSCLPSGGCWALATTTSQAVQWNGHQWGTPVQFSAFDALSSLSCVSATDCWAAGYYVKPNQIQLYNLVMHWNGQAWAMVKAPQPAGGGNQLDAVSCVSATDCWAGGSDVNTAGHTRNELLHWNGSGWALVPAPAGPLVNSEVLAVQCPAAGDCWATGDDNARPEALHWNGSEWSLVTTPNPGGAGFLYGVSCVRSSDCLAVGFSHVPPVRNLALHWNGTKWTAV